MGIFHWTIVVYQRESPAKLTYPLKIVDWKMKFPHFLVKKGGAFWGTSVSLPEGILSFTKHVMTLGHQKPEAYRPTGHWCNTTCWVDVCCWAWNGHTAPEEIPPPWEPGNLHEFRGDMTHILRAYFSSFFMGKAPPEKDGRENHRLKHALDMGDMLVSWRLGEWKGLNKSKI